MVTRHVDYEDTDSLAWRQTSVLSASEAIKDRTVRDA